MNSVKVIIKFTSWSKMKVLDYKLYIVGLKTKLELDWRYTEEGKIELRIDKDDSKISSYTSTKSCRKMLQTYLIKKNIEKNSGIKFY